MLAPLLRFWIGYQELSRKRIAVGCGNIVQDQIARRYFNHDPGSLVIVTEISFYPIVVAAVIQPEAGPDVVGKLVSDDAPLIEFRDQLCPAAMPTGVVSVDIVVNDAASLDQMAFASSSNTGVAVTRHYAIDQAVPITAQADASKVAPCDHAILQSGALTVDVASRPV